MVKNAISSWSFTIKPVCGALVQIGYIELRSGSGYSAVKSEPNAIAHLWILPPAYRNLGIGSQPAPGGEPIRVLVEVTLVPTDIKAMIHQLTPIQRSHDQETFFKEVQTSAGRLLSPFGLSVELSALATVLA
uniref:Uncharacterized protein n=1 Tax=Acrobeloides nanus TaxID=290746 RepID=A0A914DGW0_9BILA